MTSAHCIGACHVHSTWSFDGRWPLEKISREFVRRGYSVVLLTEHDRGFSEARRREHRQACADASSDRLLLVPGIEYSDEKNRVHTLVWGDVPFVGENIPPLDLLKIVKREGGVAVWAHPGKRRAIEAFSPEWTEYLSGIEVWNRKSDGWAPGRAALRLAKTHQLPPWVGMDFHDERQLFPLAMTLPNVPPASPSLILEYLRKGKSRPMVFGCRLRFLTRAGLLPLLRLAERWRNRTTRST